VHAQGREPVDSVLSLTLCFQFPMKNSPLNKTAPVKPPLFAGIDVGAEELVLVIRKNGKPFDPQKFGNTPSDRGRLVKKLAKLPNLTVCLEATGVYHFDLSIALHDAGVRLMVVNPKASHNFAKVLIPHRAQVKNSKTDAVDANTLAEYAARMDFVPWTRPSGDKIALRSFARRIDTLTRQKAAAKNHLHALTATSETPKAVLKDAQLGISQLEKRIGRLSAEARVLIDQAPELTRVFTLLTVYRRLNID